MEKKTVLNFNFLVRLYLYLKKINKYITTNMVTKLKTHLNQYFNTHNFYIHLKNTFFCMIHFGIDWTLVYVGEFLTVFQKVINTGKEIYWSEIYCH